MSDYDIEHATRDELEDRLTDQALAEALAGKRPPDLTGAILNAARPSSVLYRARGLLAAAATVLIAVALVALARSRDPESQIVRSNVVWPAANPSAAKLAAIVDEYNRLLDEQRFAEAEVVAKRALGQFPNAPVAQHLARQSRMIRAIRGRVNVSGEGLGSVEFANEAGVPPDSASSTSDVSQFVIGTHSHHDASKTLPSSIAPQSSEEVGARGSIAGFEGNLSLVVPEEQGEKRSREIAYTVVKPYYDTRTKEICYTVCKPVYESDLLLTESVASHDRRAQSLMSLVTPRIIIQEEDEELLRIDGEEPAPPTLREILHQPTELKVVEAPLAAALAQFAEKHNVTIVLDHAGLAAAETQPDTAVTWTLKDLPLKDALRNVLAEHELAFVVVGDSLLVTSMTNAGVALERRVFPVGDLILPAFDPDNLPPDHGRGPGESGDRYERIEETPFLRAGGNPLSTFSIDVDTASYAKVRRYLQQSNMLPPPDAVRIEELINYFSYDYAPPQGDAPFSAHVEVAACPWQPRHRLARIGIQGRIIENRDRPASNLVFLVDVSGSMEPDDKLPRVRRALRMLVEQLGESDRVAIVVYAAATGLVLPSTPGTEQGVLLSALESLESGGSTNGGAGIQLAYDTAAAHFIAGGTNRVILCTDGDFNVGVTSDGELERLIEQKAQSGVFLSVLGFGMGNHNDSMLEKLADKGNGNHGYIDTEQEARKLLVDEIGGTLVTIAKDVKLQVEFNPQQVAAYRLIGYENRMLRSEDFNDDTKDAGEIGAGHAVTALYEIIPAGELPPVDVPEVEPLRYQTPAGPSEAAASGELLTLRIRYKDPDATESHEPLVFPVRDEGLAFGQASADFKFASAVASFGMLLRGSDYRGETSFDAVLEIAQEGIGADPHGYRQGFLELVRKAKELAE